MRNLTYYVATSLDGKIASPQGDWADFLSEGDHMNVILTEFGDAIPTHVHAQIGTSPSNTLFDTVIMGWNTYTPALDAGITSPYQHLRQIVVSHKSHDLPADLELTHDPVTTVKDLKDQPGKDIWLAGGGLLASSLLPLIDRLILKINPVVFAAGIPPVRMCRLYANTIRFDRTPHFFIRRSHCRILSTELVCPKSATQVQSVADFAATLHTSVSAIKDAMRRYLRAA